MPDGNLARGLRGQNNSDSAKGTSIFWASERYLGGGFKKKYVHLYLGKIPILTNIFQMGWNHQPDIVQDVWLEYTESLFRIFLQDVFVLFSLDFVVHWKWRLQWFRKICWKFAPLWSFGTPFYLVKLASPEDLWTENEGSTKKLRCYPPWN